MKQKILLATTITILACSAAAPATPASIGQPAIAEAKARKVYYVPGSSYAYHSSKRCRALSRSKNIKAISIKTAKAKGLKKCGMRGCW